MNQKKVSLSLFVLFALFFGTMVTNGMGFSQTPTYIDPGGDSLPPCTDILAVWIDNDASYLRFKFELNGSFNQYDWPVYITWISIDNSTGLNAASQGAPQDFDLPVDYKIYFEIYATGEVYTYLTDCNNGSNNHDDPFGAGLLYYNLSNNNHTLEYGYKIQTGDPETQGKGFLNVSIGQTIYLKFQGEIDPDLVPDSSLMIRYTLPEESGGIPGFTLPFLSFAVFAMITCYFLAKKKTLI
ncbi:MAG TPA: hypothetical protein VMV49_08930 [Candidatus Deferrimicrobium sp.]|nr:hypothetical protein [Candidatus Deferrimicrobium sp.]